LWTPSALPAQVGPSQLQGPAVYPVPQARMLPVPVSACPAQVVHMLPQLAAVPAFHAPGALLKARTSSVGGHLQGPVIPAQTSFF